jgi:hypothetical protein
VDGVAVRPPWFIIGRTAKPSTRRRPVNSALGCALRNCRVHLPSRHQQPSGASALLGNSSKVYAIQQLRRLVHAVNAALRGKHLRCSDESFESQFHGRAACGSSAPLRPGRAGGAEWRAPHLASSSAYAASYWPSLMWFNRQCACQRPSAPPNLSLNRSANGKPPWPRCASGSSCASRPRRLAVVARLAQR